MLNKKKYKFFYFFSDNMISKSLNNFCIQGMKKYVKKFSKFWKMTRPPPTELKIFLSATDYNAAEKYLHEAIETYKNSFKGELKFVPRSPGFTGRYTNKQMEKFPAHVEDVIRANGLKPYKSFAEPHIICCQTKYIPLCNRHPHLNTGPAISKAKKEAISMETDPKNRTIIIYPFRFNEREKKFRQKLICWRNEPFKGKITIKPQGDYYSVNQKDLPQHIIKICKSVRIKAEISKTNPSLIECDLQTLLPKRKKAKSKKKTEATELTSALTADANNNNNDQQQQKAGNSQTEPAPKTKPPIEKEIISSLIDNINAHSKNRSISSDSVVQSLTRDVEIKFSNFPKVYTANNIVFNDMKDDTAESTSLVMIVDLQSYPVNTASDYAWEILEWADSYKFLTIHFLVGPPTRIPMAQEPKLRSMLINAIKQLSEQQNICYKYEIAEKNHNLLICRHK